jgi:hypothetical protein
VVDKQNWEIAKSDGNDMEAMKRCCHAELDAMDKSGLVAAPHYFERVAILSRKAKNYTQEIYFCDLYISKIEAFFEANGAKGVADVRKGPTFKAIAKRLKKARELANK